MKWIFIWISRVQRILFKDTANEWKAQIKWNENKLWEKAKDIEKENVSLQYIHYYKRKEETWPQPTR